jgi:hypothetical protein
VKRLLLSFSVLLSWSVMAQTSYFTHPVSDQIKTLQVNVDGSPMSLPVISLTDQKVIVIQFDEMSHDSKNYYYSIRHCDADWTLSNVSNMEAIDGYSTGTITESALSVNTTFLYTHYWLRFPNENTQMKLSGNYVVTIYEDNDPDKVVAYACFSVVEAHVTIQGTVRGNTDTEMNGRYQQLDFTIDNSNFPIRDVFSELHVVVRQNDRRDNEVSNIKPTYTTQSLQTYSNNKSLIFEGGNSYRQFDISSVYLAAVGVHNIQFESPYYHAMLYDDAIRADRSFEKEPDVHGNYLINLQNHTQPEIEADYIYVHFTLPDEHPLFEGSLYLSGNFVYNQFNDSDRLDYNGQHQAYQQTLLLKQGGYNYLYLYVPKGGSVGSTFPIEGSYWQTDNQYVIYAYYRPMGDRYDRLIGFTTIQ